MRKLPLQSPLIWHTYLFISILGAFYLLWPMPALAMALLLLANRRLWNAGRIAICITLFLASFWFTRSHFEYLDHLTASPPALSPSSIKGAPICGNIISVRGRPNGRLRVLLENVHPRNNPSKVLPGLCSWAWVDPWRFPAPGEQVCLKRPVGALHGVSNLSLYSMEATLYSQKILWHIWSIGDMGKPVFSGEPGFISAIREKLRLNFLGALHGDSASTPPDIYSSSGLGQGKGILLALLFGDRFYLRQDTMNNFAAAAIAHSLALSGQHLAVASLLGMGLIMAIAKLHPSIYLARPRTILSITLSIPLAIAYLWLGDAAPSLLRAAMMLMVLAVFIWRGAVFTAMDLLCAALLLILIWQPLAIFDIGLQLSALCIGAIAIFAPAMHKLTPRALYRKGRFWQFVRGGYQILLVSFIIQGALLPVSLSRFQIAGLWLPFNIIWLPVLGMFVLPMGVLGLLISSLPGDMFRSLASIILDAAALPCDLLVMLLDNMSGAGLLAEPVFSLPHWSAFPAFALAAFVIASFFSHPPTAKNISKTGKLLCLALAMLSIGPILRLKHSLDDKIYFDSLDVGQGLSLLVKIPGGGRILLDGGGNPFSNFDSGKGIIAPYLLYLYNDSTPLAAVINSHPDLDHLGGLFHVLRACPVGQLFHNGAEPDAKVKDLWKNAKEQHKAIALREGDQLRVSYPDSDLVMEILNPPRPPETLKEDTKDLSPKALNKYLHEKLLKGNGASIVIRICRNGEGLALFTGDMEKNTIERLLDKEVDLRAKILFAPHHGSDRSFLPKFYDAVKPEIVVVSCGFANRWEFPGQRLAGWLRAHDIGMLDTARYGRIELGMDKLGNIYVETLKNPKKNSFF